MEQSDELGSLRIELITAVPVNWPEMRYDKKSDLTGNG